MEQTWIIPKNEVRPHYLDYEALRKEGLQYIENLCSNLWTDYNEHDPGITILESLCYALTELGYRVDFPIEDLLANTNGNTTTDQAFFSARTILTSSPLTVLDYRKLLVDLVGVHNAWVFTGQENRKETDPPRVVNEVPLYADCKKDALSTFKTDHPIYLSGLYSVLIDLEQDDQYGDLNIGHIDLWNPTSTILINGQPKFKAGEIVMTMELPYVGAIKDSFIKAASDPLHISNVVISLENTLWKATITTDTPDAPVSFIISINLQPPGKKIELADLQDFFSKNFTAQIFTQYKSKTDKISEILLKVRQTLMANRNLAEDFVSIETVKDEDIAICCDIDVRPDADIEQVEAQVFYLIENYFDPTVNFYLLQELIAKGLETEEIFNGPRLQHGFIIDKELSDTQLRSKIHSSDLISMIMDIDGVLAVRNFLMTKYDDQGKPVSGQTGIKWCMSISENHKPVLAVSRSKIVFYKNDFPILASNPEISDTLKLLKATQERPKLTGQQNDLEIPTGTYRPLEEYYSIQNDFPQTYGIGPAGLAGNAPDLRKAQAHQLKAYLLFYDQLLADFFSQLRQAQNLFSLKPLVQTYFAQYLNSIPGYIDLFRPGSPGPSMLETLLQTPDSTIASSNSAWKALYESADMFEDRRNRFLDHLMARFAESFNEYVLMLYSLNYKDKTAISIQSESLIASKIDFIKSYPGFSYERGRGFNYMPLDSSSIPDPLQLWNSDNVSGLEKRVAKLSGIKNVLRRFLSCIKNIEILPVEQQVVENGIPLVKTFYQLIIENELGDQLIQNGDFPVRLDLEKLVSQLPPLFTQLSNYHWDPASKKIQLLNTTQQVVLITKDIYNDATDAQKHIQQFVKEMGTDCGDAEGMLLIEHILLRPRDATYQLMEVCLDKECDFCGEQDPYTFHVSVYLPYWPERFNSLTFRTYFEQTIRTEAPAHIMVKVCWLDNTQLRELELSYKRWMEALQQFAFSPLSVGVATEMKLSNDALMNLLPTLHTVYPEATLHDCEESMNTNPVLLGKTILGTLKNSKL